MEAAASGFSLSLQWHMNLITSVALQGMLNLDPVFRSTSSIMFIADLYVFFVVSAIPAFISPVTILNSFSDSLILDIRFLLHRSSNFLFFIQFFWVYFACLRSIAADVAVSLWRDLPVRYVSASQLSPILNQDLLFLDCVVYPDMSP